MGVEGTWWLWNTVADVVGVVFCFLVLFLFGGTWAGDLPRAFEEDEDRFELLLAKTLRMTLPRNIIDMEQKTALDLFEEISEVGGGGSGEKSETSETETEGREDDNESGSEGGEESVGVAMTSEELDEITEVIEEATSSNREEDQVDGTNDIQNNSGAESMLPWKAVKDPALGRTYWYNTTTHVSQWEQPVL